MSKGKGQKVVIKFTEELQGDITGLEPPIGIRPVPAPIEGNVTASSGSNPQKVLKGIEPDDQWSPKSNPSWLQIELVEPLLVAGFRWTSLEIKYRPKDFSISGSKDGTTWENLFTGQSPNLPGWNRFEWPFIEPYKFYKWDITNSWDWRPHIYLIEFILPGGNEVAFTLSGKQQKYAGGPMINKDYRVDKVNLHSAHNDDKHLLLTLEENSRFSNVEGDIKVEYDSTAGSLQGSGGIVKSFSKSFTPEGLIPEPIPGTETTFKVTVNPLMNFFKLNKIEVTPSEEFNVELNCKLDFIYVGTINP